MEVCTIGFAGKSATEFFGLVRAAGIRRLIDVRLNNVSQLAGFTKRNDLPFFLQELCSAEYIHEPLLAPSAELLAYYRKEKGGWSEYERMFIGLMRERRVEETISRSLFDLRTVLLCTEPTAAQCHRRLVVEYLSEQWGDITPVHL
jgi:uncharacterized protein (DUF488 family)